MTTKHTTQSVTVAVDRELVNRAHDAGSNMSVTLTVTLNAELKKHAATCWHEKSVEAIAVLNQSADEAGYFSGEYRSFQRCNLQYTAAAAGAPHSPLLLVLPVTLLARLTAVSLSHQHLLSDLAVFAHQSDLAQPFYQQVTKNMYS